MEEGGFDYIEMRDKNLKEEEEEEEEEAETKFSEDEDPWDIRDYPENFDSESPKRVDTLSKLKKDAGNMKRRITTDSKRDFREFFKIDIQKKDGENSKILIEETEFIPDPKNNESIKVKFRGKDVGKINKNGKWESYKKWNKKYLDEFNDRLKDATEIYQKSLDSVIDEQLVWDNYQWDPYERNFFKDEIRQNSIERLNNSIEDIQENMKETEMSEQDVRELNGVLNPKGKTPQEKIDFLDVQADHWRQKALLEVDEGKEKWYKEAEKTTRLVADKLLLENDLRPEEEETVSILREEIEESDMGRLEKFKRLAKDNLLGLSGIAITVAGILTTIIVASRNALKSGAKAVGQLGKALVNIGKNFGALISSLLNLVGSILAWGAKGITFLAKNLWILAIAITYFLYNEYKERRRRK